jgi:hypothetical protein
VKLGDRGQVVDVQRRNQLTLKEGASTAYNLAYVVKAIAQSGNPIGYYTSRVTKQQASAKVITDPTLTQEQKDKFTRELNSFAAGDIVKFEDAVPGLPLGPIIKQIGDAAPPRPPLIVVFEDP